jgi:hypothetical protein
MAQDREVTDCRRWSYRLGPLVSKQRDLLLAQPDQVLVSEIMSIQHAIRRISRMAPRLVGEISRW